MRAGGNADKFLHETVPNYQNFLRDKRNPTFLQYPVVVNMIKSRLLLSCVIWIMLPVIKCWLWMGTNSLDWLKLKCCFNQQVAEDLDLEWFATNTTRDFPFFQKVLNIVSNYINYNTKKCRRRQADIVLAEYNKISVIKLLTIYLMYISRHTFLDNAVTRFLFLYIILYLIAPVLNFVIFLISLCKQQQLFETSSKRVSNDLV